MSFATSGSFPASLLPSQRRQVLNNNYLNFADGTSDWAQQYLPELYEQEVERYGNRTLSGFLRMVGAEMPMTSDQVIWSEQNRLHVAYNQVTMSVIAVGTATARATITLTAPAVNQAIKVNQTVLVSDNATGLVTQKFLVNAIGAAPSTTIDLIPYDNAGVLNGSLPLGANTCSIFVYGSEWDKGSSDATTVSITPGFQEYSNSPIIIRDKYQKLN